MVNLGLTDTEATELEYAIKYRISGLKSPSTGCLACKKMPGIDYCETHAPMVAILETVKARLIATGFSLQS